MNKLFVKDKSFYILLFTLAFPVVCQNMITIGVNIMDTIMLGSYGEIQLSGSSLANDFINLFQILCMGVGCGAGVLTAQYYGRQEYENVRTTVTVMLRVICSIALGFTLLAWFIPDKIMGIYTTDREVIAKGVIYLRWSLITFFLHGCTQTITLVLRTVRDVKIPLYTSIGSFFVNVFFNWVFIFGNLGAPEMQIAGAALGTVIARVFEFSIVVGYFLFKEKLIGFRLKHIFNNTKEIFPVYVKYSIPVIFSDMLLGLGNSAVSVVIGHIGTSFVAANSIVAMIQRLCTTFTSGIGQASAVITGNTIGKGDLDRAFLEGRTMIALSILLGIITGGVILLIGPSIVNMYNIEQVTKDIANQLLMAISIMVVFQSLQSVLTKGILRGGGDTKYVMFADATFLWLVSVPLGWVTGVTLGMSAFIVYICLKIDWIIKDILCMRRFFQKKWIKEV
ncbi:MAG: MATE family efflux transporter [Erysipelotrichaceae bacterium]|nr:MATE family efflux transporter [Erysipelotrichaceae bacterium]